MAIPGLPGLSTEHRMRVGIYGGTFDPVHLAHLVLADQCRDALGLDQVWFVPNAVSPLKSASDVSSPQHRRLMLELALAGDPRTRLEPCELDRPGPSFTVTTLEYLSGKHPDIAWSLLMGADSVRDLPRWRSPERIVALARLVAVNRGDDAPPTSDFQRLYGDRIDVVSMPAIDISATDIRRRVREGRSIRHLVPRAVECYIGEHGLYRR